MEKKLSFTNYLTIGSLLFGLFFGAGNLIFPVHMGQLAGANSWLATIGFIITGVGLPFLGIIAIGFSKSDGLFDLASRIHPAFGYFFTVVLYLSIGPFFALPRTATVSFEVGFAPYLSGQWLTWGLLLFTLGFFILAWAFSLRPAKIMLWIGKILNPLFLLFLAVLIFKAFTQPMGVSSEQVVQDVYLANPLVTGAIEGYNTMDVLASLAFGIIVVNSFKNLGVSNTSQIAKGTFKSGLITLALMSIIYSSLTFIGATSVNQFPITENGGLALNQIANYYFGGFGSFLLAIIVTLACLKTGIGLITACSETFVELFPKISYTNYVHLFSALGCLIANFGLTSIIKFSYPALMFLYPLAISLVFLALCSPLFKHHSFVYQLTIGITLISSIIEGIKASALVQLPGFKQLVHFYNDLMPLANINLGWILPTTIFFVLAWIFSRYIPNKAKTAL